jgi:hypothetical protein
MNNNPTCPMARVDALSSRINDEVSNSTNVYLIVEKQK